MPGSALPTRSLNRTAPGARPRPHRPLPARHPGNPCKNIRSKFWSMSAAVKDALRLKLPGPSHGVPTAPPAPAPPAPEGLPVPASRVLHGPSGGVSEPVPGQPASWHLRPLLTAGLGVRGGPEQRPHRPGPALPARPFTLQTRSICCGCQERLGAPAGARRRGTGGAAGGGPHAIGSSLVLPHATLRDIPEEGQENPPFLQRET